MNIPDENWDYYSGLPNPSWYQTNNIMKIRAYQVETYQTFICREVIEIDTELYPELEGKTEEEIQEYIKENKYEMKPMDDSYYDSLGEEMNDATIVKEKIYNHDGETRFE